MELIKDVIVTIVCALIASSGFWAIMAKRLEKKDNKSKLLIGLGHDRIMSLGMEYIKRGWITTDEYENLNHYLYTPYKEAGGNGSAERIMQEVNKLPIREIKFEHIATGGDHNG